MSEEQQLRRPHDHEAITYGDVFNVGGELASKPITPRDAATVQSVESQILGETPKGGPAAMMESAAAKNERAGLVSHKAVTNLARNEGVTLSQQCNEEGNRVFTETLGGQVVVESDDTPKGTMMGDDPLGSTVDDGIPASVKGPEVRTIEDYDFISNQSVADHSAHATLNPLLSGNQDKNPQSNVPAVNVLNEQDKRVTSHENPDVISSVPGGMGASMATADHRVKKNK